LIPKSPPDRARGRYHSPVFSIDFQGSWGARESPFWSNSIEMLSGDRTNAMNLQSFVKHFAEPL